MVPTASGEGDSGNTRLWIQERFKWFESVLVHDNRGAGSALALDSVASLMFDRDQRARL